MNLDIRFPMGWMFSLFGILLTGFGLFGNRQIYERSLGININFDSGVGLLVFGILMLLLAWRGSAKAKAGQQASPKS
jgi:hypothetical protein